MNSKQRTRARFVFILIILGAGVLASGLYWTQIAKGPSYAARAEKQYVKPVGMLFDRGSIYFQSKDGTRSAAATLGTGFVVYMNPTQVSNATQEYDALSQYLTLDRSDFLAKAKKPRDQYEVLAAHLDATSTQSIKGLSLPGIGISPETWRSYPGNSMAAHVLGIIGENASSTSVSGKYGLERTYENVLGRTGASSRVNAFAQLLYGFRTSVFGDADGKGGDLVTTIEPTTQKYLEKILAQTLAIWHSDEIGGIVIDPHTGEIVAMSSLPVFDPNSISTLKNVSVLSNPLIEHVYEMGSIMKPLTMATALDTKAVTTSSTYTDTGTMTLSGKKISNYDGKARGITSMQEILSQSLNVGVATIALKVGKDAFAKYFMSFGLGEKTNIDLPNEAAGIVGNLKTGRDVEIATAAYGQGIAISPVNMARALSVLANGGYVVTPHVVRKIDYTDGTSKSIEVAKKGPVLASETVDEVTRMLVKVVDDKIAQAHPDIHFEHYSIAAKTGTAQIADHASGGYYPDRYLHSFFGYFPAYDPKFLVFLYQVYPKGAQYASETLTDPFSEITKFLLNYYNVAPDR